MKTPKESEVESAALKWAYDGTASIEAFRFDPQYSAFVAGANWMAEKIEEMNKGIAGGTLAKPLADAILIPDGGVSIRIFNDGSWHLED